MAGHLNITEQKICGWSGFNIMTSWDKIPVKQDTVGYLPTINTPAIAMSSVNEVLGQALKIKDCLNLKEIVYVFDQALYAKAVDITWKQPEKFQPIVLRMGVFHTICNFLGIIDKRFLGAGLRDLAFESDVIAEGPVDRVLNGQQYNRGLRLHKLVYEALQRIAWKGFLDWFEKNWTAQKQSLLEDLRSLAVNLNQSANQANLEEIMYNPRFALVFDHFQQYLSLLRSDAEPLAQFWMSYIDGRDSSSFGKIFKGRKLATPFLRHR